MPKETAVRTASLRREYRTGRRRAATTTVALDGVDLEIPRGEVHGLLGPNGAGKTTLCKILSTVLLPTSGNAEVAGYDVVTETDQVRHRMGIVFGGERGLYFRLTARRNLRYWGALHRLSDREAARRADELLERVGLTARADEHVETFSRGMKQRLHLARGLISDPEVLLLDEPTTGMDPVAARDFRALVGELHGEGRTILITTHDMVEAESLCERVTLIDRGQLLATETPRTLATWISRFERVDVDVVEEDALAAIASMPGVGDVIRRDDGGARIETTEDGAAAEVLRRLLDHGASSIRTSLPSLEEVYLHVVGDRAMDVQRTQA
jgi:ABC-2 type transport system ATP-binding protein